MASGLTPVRQVAWVFAISLVLSFCGLLPRANAAATGSETTSAGQVMQEFTQLDADAANQSDIPTKRKHQILFYMGVALLVLLLTTAGLGVTMALSGKPLYVPHMIFAGLSVSLAIAHSVVAIVWFFPF